MKIALVTAFPPSRKPLNEYGFHIANHLRQSSGINLTVLADHLPDALPELPGFHVVRCWGFDRVSNLVMILRQLWIMKPDVVWFNLGFGSLAAKPLPAMLGLSTPLATRLAGLYTHVTLHQLFETVDLADAGVTHESLYSAGGWVATHLLLSANSVNVLLPTYRKILQQKYKHGRVSTRSHGVFTGRPVLPDFSKRGNPSHRVLAFGKWGTYKRLELLIDAFRLAAAVNPNAELWIAGGDHPKTPGYVASMAERYASARIRFLGYVPEKTIGELFQSASIVVMPYSSSAGASGVAHLAAQYAVPILAADISDFRELVECENLAIEFFSPEDTQSLANQMTSLLASPQRLTMMANQNFEASLQMTMPEVVRQYVRWFDLGRRLKTLQGLAGIRQTTPWLRAPSAAKHAEEAQSWDDGEEPEQKPNNVRIISAEPR